MNSKPSHETAAAPGKARRTRKFPLVLRVLTAVALALFAAGVVVGASHIRADTAAILRWAGLALFVPVAVNRRSLLMWTFLAMVAGAELGVDAPHFAMQTRFLSDIFLRLIRMIVAPLIFGGLVTGIAGHGELRGVGRVALKALIFFEVVTTLGIFLGALAINLSGAGWGVVLPAAAQTAAGPAHAPGWQDVILNVFPENIAQAVAQNQVLQVAVFALLFGVALAMLPESRRTPLVTVLQSLTDVMFRITKIVMLMAPVAAGAALAYAVGSMGLAHAGAAGQAGGNVLYGAGIVRAPGADADRFSGAHSRGAVLRRGGRAGGHWICHNDIRGRIAAGDGAHGGVRRAAVDCFLRDPDGLQLQHDRIEPVSLHGRDFCRAGSGHAPERGRSSSSWCSR